MLLNGPYVVHTPIFLIIWYGQTLIWSEFIAQVSIYGIEKPYMAYTSNSTKFSKQWIIVLVNEFLRRDHHIKTNALSLTHSVLLARSKNRKNQKLFF